MGIHYRKVKQYFGNYLVVVVLLLSCFTIGPSVASTGATSCLTPLGKDTASNAKIVSAAYSQWKGNYLTSSGAGGDLRVQRSADDNYDTVSEGIAYGMLFAVYNNDKSTFDGLWAYAQKHVNSNGVMNWRIAADGSVTGYNGATDADEDIAAALVAADTTWGGYKASAIRQITIIKQHQVEQGTNILKPGDVWGGSNVLNPSYVAPSYYDLFQAYTGDASWAAVKSANYAVLKAAQDKTTGLVPDWSTASGAPASGMGYEYSYDASRSPLRLALSVGWSCDTLAADLLEPFNNWSAGKNLSQLASSYTLSGMAKGNGDSTPLLAAAVAAASASKNDTYRSASWNALVNTPSTTYYPDSMRLFGLLVATGAMVSPIDLPQRQPVAAEAPATLQISGADAATVVGRLSELSLHFTAPYQQDNVLLDIELYDKNGRKVAQKVYENQTLQPTTKTYTLQWTPDVAGEYTLKGGIFTAGWAQNLIWNDRAATVAVAAGAPASPQPVAPIPSSSPLVSPSLSLTPEPTPIPSVLRESIGIWWPGSTQSVAGTQPFKAVVDGKKLADYDMYWQVDGGRLNDMDSIYDEAPHKEAWVNLSDWSWSPTGRYTINFVAKNKSGTLIAQKATIITVVK